MKLKSIKPPKHTQRRIIWNKSEHGGWAVMLVGYCPDTLPYFMGLAGDLLKTFPKANINNATCGRVSKSDCVQGFTALICPVPGRKRIVKGWEEYASIDFNY